MGTMRFAHFGIAVSDMQKAIVLHESLFGQRVLSGPVDDPVSKVTVCFLASSEGDEFVVELVAPLTADSPIRKILTTGGGAYHTCYEVDDLDTSLREARSLGCILLGQPLSAVAFGGRRIAWFYTPLRQLVEILEK